jgi:hypothetical protein
VRGRCVTHLVCLPVKDEPLSDPGATPRRATRAASGAAHVGRPFRVHAASTGARSASVAGACPSSFRTAFSAAGASALLGLHDDLPGPSRVLDVDDKTPFQDIRDDHSRTRACVEGQPRQTHDPPCVSEDAHSTPVPTSTIPAIPSSPGFLRLVVATSCSDLPNALPLTCGTRASTIAPRARDARERGPVPSGAAAVRHPLESVARAPRQPRRPTSRKPVAADPNGGCPSRRGQLPRCRAC